MQIQVSGQQISIGTSLQEYVKGRIESVALKYFSEATNTHIHFSKRGYEFICDIVVTGNGRHVVIKSNASSDEVYNSFDISLTKIEKQLRRYKSKLKDHSKQLKISEITQDAVKYIISRSDNEESEIDEFNIDNPAIISEKQTQILLLSVGEAVMKMDLENLPALMFKNSNTNRVNVVYYRKDGNISWIDSNI